MANPLDIRKHRARERHIAFVVDFLRAFSLDLPCARSQALQIIGASRLAPPPSITLNCASHVGEL